MTNSSLMRLFLLSIFIFLIISCPSPVQPSVEDTVSSPVISPNEGIYTTEQTISITCETDETSIRYTTDNSNPTSASGALYTSPFTVEESATVKAIAYREGWQDSAIADAYYIITGKVETPVITLEEGTYETAQTVSINCATPDASIRYTTDNTDPSESSGTLYTGIINISSSCTVKAVAYRTDWETSNVVSATYTITGSIADPVISPNEGIYTTGQTVSILCDTDGTSIRYSTDNSEPSSTLGTLYTSPFIVDESATVKAIAYREGWEDSDIITASYVITGKVEAPVISPSSGTYDVDQPISINCETPEASIRYTVDGTDPSESTGILYTDPVRISSSCTVKAVAYLTDWEPSGVVSSTYTITGTVANPVISPDGGTYTTGPSVSISCLTDDAYIRYTTNNSDPSPTSGTLYTAPFTVSESATVKAIAYREDWEDSEVISTSYVITGTVEPPVITPQEGSYDSAQSVSISCATEGVAIRYTTDNTAPTSTTGILYSTPFSISESTIVKAIAYKTDWADSSIATAEYTISQTIADPVLDPGSPNPRWPYSSPKTVTMSSESIGASIRYTTDGTDPSETTGILYEGSIIVSQPTTIKAIAYKDGCTSSQIVTEVYLFSEFTVGNITYSEHPYNDEEFVVVDCELTATGSIVVAESFNGWPVTGIEDFAFDHCFNITNIILPETIMYIGIRGFYYCSALESVNIPSSVTAIGRETFYNCESLTEIILPEGLETIDVDMFQFCSSITQITIPSSVTSINDGAFSGMGLTSITIPDTVTSLGFEVFRWCYSLETVQLSNGLSELPGSAFRDCVLLNNITIPEGISTIGTQAFAGCTGLTALTLPAAVSSIEQNAFYECTGLTDLYINATQAPNLGLSVFSDNARPVIHIPSGATGYSGGDWDTLTIIEDI